MSYLLVFLGGGLGAAARHGVNVATARAAAWPVGTLTVNVVGSLLMGALVGWLARRGASAEWRLFAATGVLGGFTTFSAFSLDVVLLWERAAAGAVLYAAATLVLTLSGVFAGLWLVRP